MVMNFIGNLIGGLFGSNSANSLSQRDYLEQAYYQYQYNRGLNEQTYDLNSRLNRQMFDYNRDLTRYNYDFQRQSRQTAFVDTRKDLESAGYNPLLALGQQSGSLNPGLTMSGSGLSSADSNAIFSAVSTAGNIAKIKSDIKSSDYVNDLNLAYAEKARSETRGQDINNVIQDRTGLKKALQEIENLKKQGLLSEKQAKYYEKSIAVANSQIALNSAQAIESRSRTVLNQQEKDLQEPSVRFARKHPVAHGALQRIGSPTSAIGALAGLKYMFGKK